ncbi:YbhB/YbcL family Raf kinase inhibitor-like protein [Tahibacter harae]|uniref:YbhB/YbcL family Raf kinase inhibitor-like protein n=1 Tax=Tahibacter harae TaxID=2963937 RepID=A0ABT1QMZ6_9GAMM|nr:YbhB/YbcL family Raf kinase inhibitor-like protein [Tahibacter harae]MCQ4163898.1 YbhB/YbcL family Raf kinase inhibitor-like protein [Tahibacter harae]
MKHIDAFALFLTAGLCCAGADAAAPVADVQVTGHVFQPAALPPPDPAELKVAAGFAVEVLARDLGNARMLAVADNGNVYVTRRDSGDVLLLRVDGAGRLQGQPQQVASRPGVHGIAIHKQRIYLATAKEIYAADIRPDGGLAELQMLVHDLPDAGQHNNRTLRVGPDEMLYISVGSTCNECNESNPENATLLRTRLDGTGRAIFASGLRNTIGFDWQPQTGELWGMDHGIDWLGDDTQPEELNRIERGKRYGWPFFYADNQENPHQKPPGKLPPAAWKAGSTPMVLGYTAHAAPMQMAFYTAAQFPAEYQGDAFVAMRGSWNRKPASGYEVVRIDFDQGRPRAIASFVSGFLSERGQSARPAGLAVAGDGSLLFSDDANGVIYRVRYTGGAPGAKTAAAAPAGPMQEQAGRGADVPLAQARAETAQSGDAPALQVKSAAFGDGQPIPLKHSAYDQGASFPLSWSAGPAGTRSYAIILEDPDVTRPPKPVIHWIAWNIPADVSALREGLPPQDRLTDPDGLRQGPNTPGRTGYYGPRPPAGDTPHRYHTQVFALDRMLDLPAGADREALLAAMRGHVLAKGVLVGTFARPAEPKRP